jgi:hypothetical protein
MLAGGECAIVTHSRPFRMAMLYPVLPAFCSLR